MGIEIPMSIVARVGIGGVTGAGAAGVAYASRQADNEPSDKGVASKAMQQATAMWQGSGVKPVPLVVKDFTK